MVQDSYAVDAGNPSDDYSNEPSPNGNIINIGAYGNTPYASKSIWTLQQNVTYKNIQFNTYSDGNIVYNTIPKQTNEIVLTFNMVVI